MEHITIDGIEYYRVHPLSGYNWSLAHFGKLDFNPTVYCLVASIFAVALWLVIDLIVQVHLTFTRYKGLYYWAIVCTIFGIACHAVSFTIKLFFVLSEAQQIGTTLVAKIGWIMNTSGFSMVLYSRLNLVVQNEKVLKFALAAIIVDAVLLHPPIVIFSFGMSTPNFMFWLTYMQHAERIQVVGFTLQEFALSTIYTWTAAELMRHRSTPVHRKLFIALLFAQTFAFVADTSMVVLDYNNMFTLKASLHPFIYAVKLKIEFIVLNQLLCLVQPNSDFFTYLGDPTLREPAKRKRSSVRSSTAWQTPLVEEKDQSICHRCRSLSDELCCRESSGESEAPSTPRHISFLKELKRPRTRSPQHIDSHVQPIEPVVVKFESRGDQGLDDLERQYLGRF